ncbi:MAG: 2-oxoacid:acceptor oxidoreductase family protein [Dehalococcoidia bacterium]|jgi:2-oxoglutarate ferredoxin oxidoreductase subunit gamma
MLVKTLISGFGGQGVISMGLTLAQAAMAEGRHVTYLPSYGAEVRGGTANCTVAVSNEEIASPIASSPDFVIAMNRPSLTRFQNQIKAGGVLFLNSSLVQADTSRDDIEVIRVAADAIAKELGSAKSANMVMLGAFIKKSGIVSLEGILEGLKIGLKNKTKLIAVNEKAINAGYNAVSK